VQAESDLAFGFHKNRDLNELPVVLLHSNNEWLSMIPEKVKQDLSAYFNLDKRICNLQKAQNLALGRWVSYELLKDVLNKDELEKAFIQNSEDEEDFGKPYLMINDKRSPLCLSLSHSGPVAVACYSHQSVGVDIEKIRIRPHQFEATILTTKERETLSNWKGHRDYLLTCFWTAKESVSKALGKGLRILIQNIEIFIPDITDLVEISRVSAKCKTEETEKELSVVLSTIGIGEDKYILSTAKLMGVDFEK